MQATQRAGEPEDQVLEDEAEEEDTDIDAAQPSQQQLNFDIED